MTIQRVVEATPTQWHSKAATLGGMNVHLLPDDAVIDLTSSAEERGMFLSTVVKPLAEEETLAAESSHVPSDEELESLLVAFRGKGEEEGALGARVLQLLELAARREAIALAVKRLASDPTLQYLLVAAAWRRARRGGAFYAEASEHLADALEDMEEAEGGAIRAGLNTVHQAHAFSDTAAGAEGFRATYRDTVREARTVSSMFRLIVGRFGEGDFGQGVELLLQALGSDIAAMRPSTDPTRLYAVLSEMYLVQACGTVLMNAAEFSRKLRQIELAIPPADLAASVISLCEQEVASNWPLKRMLDRYAATGGEKARFLLQATLGVLRAMPEKLFATPEHRTDQIDLVLRSLDQYAPAGPTR